MKVRLIAALAVVSASLGLAACNDADIASSNLSTAADNFEINRRIVFYNGITGDYILTIEGLCSLRNFDSNGQLSVTCKTGPNSYKKNFLGLSDNVTYFAEQLEPAASVPEQLLPDKPKFAGDDTETPVAAPVPLFVSV